MTDYRRFFHRCFFNAIIWKIIVLKYKFKIWFQPSDLLKVNELTLKADKFLPSACLHFIGWLTCINENFVTAVTFTVVTKRKGTKHEIEPLCLTLKDM